jgi:hypothetical protein
MKSAAGLFRKNFLYPRRINLRLSLWRNERKSMKSIMATYPGFQTLPRGVKRLLLTSENFFFNDATPPLTKTGGATPVHLHPWMPPDAPTFNEPPDDKSPARNDRDVLFA